MNVEEIIERLCVLQQEVVDRHVGYGTGADCFCGKSGFWGCEGYGGTFEEGYRNSGKALKFIESAVREKLDSLYSTNSERKEKEIKLKVPTIFTNKTAASIVASGYSIEEGVDWILLKKNNKGIFEFRACRAVEYNDKLKQEGWVCSIF